jgi:anti-anti-sigma factor
MAPQPADPPFDVALRTSESHVTVHISGELDIDTARSMNAAVGQIPPDATSVMLDMREVTFIDSSGVRALLETHIEMTRRDVAVTVQPSAAVARLLEITGLDAVLGRGNSWKGSPTVGV